MNEHLYAGDGPDENQPKARDPNCLACQLLTPHICEHCGKESGSCVTDCVELERMRKTVLHSQAEAKKLREALAKIARDALKETP